MSEPTSATGTRLSEVMGISHDRVNRFLWREAYEPKDLFNEASRLLTRVGGTLNVDDSTLDKPYSQHLEWVAYGWSGQHHRVVKGLNLITLYYTDPPGRSLPVNYRVDDNTEHKTKTDYFLALLAQVLEWGLEPDFITGDSWYACIINLKTVRHHRMGFLFAVESNRRVSTAKGPWVPVQQLDIPDDGRMVWLREFGEVKLFRTRLQDQRRHYVVFLPDADTDDAVTPTAFQTLHDQHWHLEQYHRLLKQVCNIETFQVRGNVPSLNHIFAALCGYVHRQQMQIADLSSNAYCWQRDLYKEVVAAFVRSFIVGKEYLNPQLQTAVNA